MRDRGVVMTEFSDGKHDILLATNIVESGLDMPAVNTLLITLELEGDAELAADCVFWTTVLSLFTVTIWLYVVESAGGLPPG